MWVRNKTVTICRCYGIICYPGSSELKNPTGGLQSMGSQRMRHNLATKQQVLLYREYLKVSTKNKQTKTIRIKWI